MSKLDEIKSIFYGEGYTISNKYGLDNKGLGKWVDDTDWLIKQVEEIEREKATVERYEKALKAIRDYAEPRVHCSSYAESISNYVKTIFLEIEE